MLGVTGSFPLLPLFPPDTVSCPYTRLAVILLNVTSAFGNVSKSLLNCDITFRCFTSFFAIILFTPIGVSSAYVNVFIIAFL